MKSFKNTKIHKYSNDADDYLKSAFSTARNRVSVTRRDYDLLHCRHDMYLRSVIHQSRMIWGRAVWRQLAKHLCLPASLDQNQPVFFVTLCDISCATKINDTAPDIKQYISYLRAGLRGLSYIGALEPAYYANVQSGSRIRSNKCVFWHVHALVWGVSKADIEQRIADLEASNRYLAVAENLPGVDCREIKQGELAQTVGYCFKRPANSYRVTRIECKRPGVPLHRFIQGKSPLRPGERVRLFHAMKNICLDQLALAAGEGAILLASAKREAFEVSGFSSHLATELANRRRSSVANHKPGTYRQRKIFRRYDTCK